VQSVLSWLIRPGDSYPIFGEDDRVSHEERFGDPLQFWIGDVLGLSDDSLPIVAAISRELQPSHRDIADGGKASSRPTSTTLNADIARLTSSVAGSDSRRK